MDMDPEDRTSSSAKGESDLRASEETVQVAVAWFPSAEWSEAVRRWPEITERVATGDHREYCRGTERTLRTFARAAHGPKVSVAPIRVDAYLTWCAERGCGPAKAGSRAGYAADLDRTGGSLPWPPDRNERCWCGSGLKYKRCCGTVTEPED